MRRLIAAAVLLVIAALTSVCTKGSKSVLLRYKYTPGTTTKYESTYKGNTRILVDDSLVVDRVHEVTAYNSIFVQESVNDTTADILESRTLEYHFVNRLSSSVTDKTKREEPVIMRVTTRGHVIRAGPKDENVRRISETSDNDSYNQELPIFPLDLVSRGQKWTQETTVLEKDRALKATITYEAESFVRERGYDCITVSYHGTAILPPDAETFSSRQVTNKITVNGLMYFAYTDGFVVSQRERRIIEGTGYQTGSNNRRLPLQVEVEYDIELSLKQPPTLSQ